MNKKNVKDHLTSYQKGLRLQIEIVMDILSRRKVFKRVMEIRSSNHKLQTENIFWGWYIQNYIDSQVLSICNLSVHNKQKAHNLIGILKRILKNEENKKFSKIIKTLLEEGLDPDIQHLVKHLVEEIDLTEIEAFIRVLEEESCFSNLKNYRDKYVAHRDNIERGIFSVTFEELDQAIDMVHKIAVRMESIINSNGYPEDSGLNPITLYDWENIFEFSWKRKQ